MSGERGPDGGHALACPLVDLVGDAGAQLAEALAESRMRTTAWPGASEEITLVVQGGRVVEVKGPPRRWKVLAKRT